MRAYAQPGRADQGGDGGRPGRYDR